MGADDAQAKADEVRSLLEAYPSDQIDADNLAQFRGFLERRLLLNRCEECGTWHQPPQPVCPRCWSRALTPTEVRGEGTIHLATVLHQGPGVDPEHPLPVVSVELSEQEGLRFTAAMTDCSPADIAVGRRVVLVWNDSSGAPWPAFRPAAKA